MNKEELPSLPQGSSVSCGLLGKSTGGNSPEAAWKEGQMGQGTASTGTNPQIEAAGHPAGRAGGQLRRGPGLCPPRPCLAPVHRRQGARTLLSRATGTLPVSPHNRELQYLNYKLKIIFTGVVLNITCNPLTLHQPHHTTSCSRLPAHVRHMADTGKGE